MKHDDPRLDDIDSSYKMAEEFEDPTTVTRRSQEPTNRQQPVIKGVLRDSPLPTPPAAPAPAATPAPVRAPAPAAPVAEAGTGGLMGWLKGLFGSAPTPPAEGAPAAAPQVAATEEKRENRGDRGDRSDRNGQRRGGRGRGSRSGEGRSGEGRGREGRNDDGRPEGREAQAGAGDANGESRRPRDGSRRNGERGERGERPERGERSERAPRERREGVTDEVQGAGDNDGNRAARPPRGDGRRSRGEGRREPLEARADSAAPVDTTPPSVDATGLGAADAAAQDERRERRPRERQHREGREGREQRERIEDRAPEHHGAEPEVRHATGADVEPAAPAVRSYFARTADSDAPAPIAPLAAPVSSPAPAPVAAAPVPAPAPAAPAPAPDAVVGMPKVGAFALPVDTLARVADQAGLSWVNSDADKVAAVQAAIAAEPRPIRVPRERPPVVELDDGPLVLVETRKDLGAVTLPFEQAPH